MNEIPTWPPFARVTAPLDGAVRSPLSPDGDTRCRAMSVAHEATPGMTQPIRIGLLNNMSGRAIQRTERDFTALLRMAAGSTPIEFESYALPAILQSRSPDNQPTSFREPIERLWIDPPDAIVVTGAEPCEDDLRREAYWGALTRVIERVNDAAIPAVFSCLAAHAAVLHMDGVPRVALPHKCFGVFEHDVASGHPFTDGVAGRMWLPHTRWNQVLETDLVRAGYQILSRSGDAGVGFFASGRGSHWLFCQGHPEYDGPNLLREYRRDVARFLRNERPGYPELPRNYLGEPEARALNSFRRRVLERGDVRSMDEFPRIDAGSPIWDAWQPTAVRVFANWFAHAVESGASARSARRNCNPDKTGPGVWHSPAEARKEI
jgi:homoserine O-succinyltransferase/O-acetyltransferase